jgi:hypothetical protein
MQGRFVLCALGLILAMTPAYGLPTNQKTFGKPARREAKPGTTFWMSVSIPNKKYWYDYSVALTHDEAQKYCRDLGGELATIVDAEEQNQIEHMMDIGMFFTVSVDS